MHEHETACTEKGELELLAASFMAAVLWFYCPMHLLQTTMMAQNACNVHLSQQGLSNILHACILNNTMRGQVLQSYLKNRGRKLADVGKLERQYTLPLHLFGETLCNHLLQRLLLTLCLPC